MDNNQAPRGDETGRFAIRVKGHLDARWSAWFDGLTITTKNDGTTLIEGPVADQAALFGVLQKMRDMGLPLLSVIRAEPNDHDRSAAEPR